MKPIVIALASLPLCGALLGAQAGVAPAARDTLRVRLELPLLDAPYNVAHGVRAPSMRQSLAVSEGFYEASHRAIRNAWGGRKWPTRLSVLLWDYINVIEVPLPGADAWIHEEFHRAVLGNRGIGSFNDVYRMNVGAAAIAVSHVRDEDLVRLKREHPAEQARLGVAGIEGEYLLVQRLERNQFFGRSPAWHQPLYWLAKLNSAAYVSSGAWDETNGDTDEMNREEGADVPRRDFTGHDFTAWAYDLHRPDEPYEARGVHPSGVGIDRYIKPADLTPAELRYLKRQGRLQLLNLLDPFLLGMRGVTVRSPAGGGPLRVTASLGHVLTSFGHTVDANLFLEQDDVRLLVVLSGYANGARRFPGLRAELLDYRTAFRGHTLDLSPRAALWLQPEGQRFHARAASPGGLVALKVHRPGRGRFGAFAEVEAKTAGWVAGNVRLDRSASVNIGASLGFR